MEAVKRIEDILEKLDIAYQMETLDNITKFLKIVVDENEGVEAGVYVSKISDYWMARYELVVDEIDDSDEVGQLRSVLDLNNSLPMGSFALDTENDLITYTITFPIDGLDEEGLSEIIEVSLFADQAYTERFYHEGEERPDDVN
jgi:hypothetical protein